jgi:iron complex transport system substrate-binding protein
VPALEEVPTFTRIPVVAEHRAVYTDGVLAGAIYFMSPLSLSRVLERLPDQLARAVAGQAPR